MIGRLLSFRVMRNSSLFDWVCSVPGLIVSILCFCVISPVIVARRFSGTFTLIPVWMMVISPGCITSLSMSGVISKPPSFVCVGVVAVLVVCLMISQTCLITTQSRQLRCC